MAVFLQFFPDTLRVAADVRPATESCLMAGWRVGRLANKLPSLMASRWGCSNCADFNDCRGLDGGVLRVATVVGFGAIVTAVAILRPELPLYPVVTKVTNLRFLRLQRGRLTYP